MCRTRSCPHTAGPYKQRDMPPISYIKNTIRFYNTSPSAIRASLTKSTSRSAIATNSTFLLKTKQQSKKTRESSCSQQETPTSVPRDGDVHRQQVLTLLLKCHLIHTQTKKQNPFNCLGSSQKMLFSACILPSFCSTSAKNHQLARNELHHHSSLQDTKRSSPCQAPVSKPKGFVEVGNSTDSLSKTPQKEISSNFVRNACNPCSPCLPVRCFLPSWNSHQLPGSRSVL